MKDKEQYKLDIVNLKAKISMCCGEDQDQRGTEAEAESSGKLQRQLQDMEERLVRTQESLDDVTYERDTYKAKVGTYSIISSYIYISIPKPLPTKFPKGPGTCNSSGVACVHAPSACLPPYPIKTVFNCTP